MNITVRLLGCEVLALTTGVAPPDPERTDHTGAWLGFDNPSTALGDLPDPCIRQAMGEVPDDEEDQ